ncbi:DsbA family oxidoreductase [Methylophilus sp. 14]|uniref:DsbA family oxidoreductase n=1 Tax=Methylophilus sp. 14 TaxID=2781019 RepID=UPI00188ED34B|nr:DsbA family oxidoreductase [Methylophilus sp. 14]MBF4988175.1 DsbA family oxidoreductase [Methylophilus sp. 14]
MVTNKVITVDIWSDFVCPWCWIAKHRFEKALKHFEHRSLVEVSYRSFRIAAEADPSPFKQAVTIKFLSEERASKLVAMVESQGQLEGLTYDFESMQFGDTLQAHCLVKSIIDPARRSALMERLYLDSTTYGKSLFTRESLKEIALDVGISEIVIDDAWRNQRLTAEVLRDELMALQYGSSVPLFVFNSNQVLSGAQSAAALLEMLNSLKPGIDATIVEDAPTCGLTSCD